MKRVFAFAGFSSAIVLLILNIIQYKYAVYITVAAAVLFVLSLVLKSLRQGKAAPVVFGAALLSCLVFMFVINNTVVPQLRLAERDDTAEVTFKITDIPYESDYGWVYTVKTQSISYDNSPQDIKLRLYTREAINADYYDTVTASMRFSAPAVKAIDSYGGFSENIFINAFIGSDCKVTKNETKPFEYYIVKARERIFESLDNALGEYSGLSCALLTGNKDRLSENVINDFKACGVAHVIAVSGLHVMIISSALLFLLRKFGFSTKAVTVFVIPFLIFYMGIAGFSKSVMRAGIMLIVMLISKMFKRKADSLNSLGIAVFLLCLNPFSVCDAGAVLTVCAVLGLVLIKPFVTDRLRSVIKPKNKIVDYILESLCVTVSVFITILPATQMFFGSVSLIVFIINIIFIIIAELAIILSIICVFVGNIPIVGSVPSALTVFINKTMMDIADYFADNFSFLLLDISNNYFAIAIAGVIALSGVSLILAKRISVKPMCIISAVFILFASSASAYTQNTTAYMAVSPQGCVAVYNKDCAVVVDADDNDDYYFAKRILNGRNYNDVLFVDCDYSSKELNELVRCNYLFTGKKHFSVDLCDAISVKYDGKIVFVTLYDSYSAVTDERIVVDDYSILRNRQEIFYTDEIYVFSFKENCDFQLTKKIR